MPQNTNETHETVKDYYTAKTNGTEESEIIEPPANSGGCCCGGDDGETTPPPHVEAALEFVPQAIKDHFYGCGSPLPPALEGCTVLDLGCGTGRDVYVASKLVGENGHVIGVDMTEEQINYAIHYQDECARNMGYAKSNVTFKFGYIEDLKSLDIEDESVDVVISNCVINLSPEKEKVFREIYRVLKPGGELYFSDVFADRRLPASLRDDKVLLGECLAGAMYAEDFRRVLAKVGFGAVTYTTIVPHFINNKEASEKTADLNFTSRTPRVIKVDGLEDREEDYGQTATYLGGIAEAPEAFEWDAETTLPVGKAVAVSGNAATMIAASRYSKYIKIDGDMSEHKGLFERCEEEQESCCCCC